MAVKAMTEEDFIEVSNWLSIRKWPMPPAEATLPDTGYVCERDGKKVAAAWAYFTNAKLIIISWMCTPPDETIRGLEGIEEIAEYVKALNGGDSAIMFMTTSDKLSGYISKKMGGTKPRACYNTFWIRRN